MNTLYKFLIIFSIFFIPGTCLSQDSCEASAQADGDSSSASASCGPTQASASASQSESEIIIEEEILQPETQQTTDTIVIYEREQSDKKIDISKPENIQAEVESVEGEKSPEAQIIESIREQEETKLNSQEDKSDCSALDDAQRPKIIKALILSAAALIFIYIISAISRSRSRRSGDNSDF